MPRKKTKPRPGTLRSLIFSLPKDMSRDQMLKEAQANGYPDASFKTVAMYDVQRGNLIGPPKPRKRVIVVNPAEPKLKGQLSELDSTLLEAIGAIGLARSRELLELAELRFKHV